ncbi:divergent AAA domain protein [Peptococcaceae bacterium CEB3]|nr:divergent AAA domain protein [Peptococcaceae bacterium CEB3]
MDSEELQNIIARDEDSRHQFKANVTNANALAAEMVAFSNSGGGQIFIGINNDGTVTGLTREDISRINQIISNAASQHIHPPINPYTENIALKEGLVLVMNVDPGLNKPYQDNSGAFWVKSGADKRKVTSREELQRMFQTSGLIHGDAVPVKGMTIGDLDLEYFRAFFNQEYGETLEDENIPLLKLLENMSLASNGELNHASALLFAKAPFLKLPVFVVKAVSYPGHEIDVSYYIESIDLKGKLSDLFQSTLSFLLRNISYVQHHQDINSLGEPEIPKIVFEEIVANALIHRDYFVSAPIRVFVFADRIEIISPGHLPNNLTVENIKKGISNIRNPILASFATRLLPYRGLGSGIRRALKAYPALDLIDDREGNMFKVIIERTPRSTVA